MFGQPIMSPSLQVVTGMITPAILILAAGSLVTSTLVRIGRIVDNIRALMQRGMEMRGAGNDEAVRIIDQMLEVLMQRNDLARRALFGYYAAISLFLLGSLAIALTLLFRSPLAWIGPLIVIIGGGFLFAASASLVVEVNLSAGSMRQEVAWYRMRAFDPPPENRATTATEIPSQPG